MNKKLILASLLCLGALVGCGGNDKPANSESTPTPGTSEVAPTPSTSVAPVVAVAEMKYSGETTTNFKGEGNEATSVGLDEKIFTVTADNGDRVNSWDGSNTPLFPGLNKAGEIRLYDKGGKKHGVTVTIAEGYEITNISVTANKQPNVRIGDTDVTASEDGSYAINGSVFFLGNDGEGQVKIKSVTINYATK